MPSAPARPGLTRDDVVDAALAIIERDGHEALSMRKLAAEVGVTSTTIYWHVGGRDEVLDAALARFAERHRPRITDGSSAGERVLDLLRQIYDQALQHPNVSRLAYDRDSTSQLQLPWQQALAAELTAAGLRGEQAAIVMRGLLYTVGGFIVVALRRAEEGLGSEEAWAGVDDPAIDADFRELLTKAPDFDAVFARTVGALVDSLVP